jgi:radical SAM superfamily enzyme YgiQ (UPF0313 family)
VKVLLVSANTERIKMTSLPLGLGMVATVVRQAGHETVFLDLLSEVDPIAAVRRTVADFSPQVIGLSIRNIDDQTMLNSRFLLAPIKEVVDVCRSLTDAPIVLGGAGYSMFPDAALSYLGADLGICGEGETAFLALLARLQAGQDVAGLPGVYVAGRGMQGERTFAEDLDRLPLPDANSWTAADPRDPDLWIPVQTRRGCPLGCSYCSTASIEGTKVRARSPQLVAEYIARMVELGFRQFYFVDNTFNLPPSYAMALCRAIADQQLSIVWRCILYPHSVPEELVAAMAEAGCVEVSLGFESGSPGVLRMMNKRFQPEEVRLISERLAARKIRRMGFLLLGGPGETPETVEESLDFAESLNLEVFSVSVGIRIYPRTPLAQLAREEGIIDAEDDLLHPRFYVRPGLETFIREAIARRRLPIPDR